MAQPQKKGLDYFSLDVDIFQDEKLEAISGEFGIKGEIVTIKLLCAIYRQGYFIEWSEMLQMKMLKILPGIKKELLNAIILRLVKWGFFDKNLFNSSNILTSFGIQKRYKEATKRRKCNIMQHFNLLNEVNVNIYPQVDRVNAHIYPQSKVKESKVKEDDILKPLDDFISEIKQGQHQIAIEQWYKELKVKKGSLTPLLTNNFKSQLLTDEKVHQNTRELKKHFKNFLNSLDKHGKLKEYKIKAIGAL